jgi:hypothetical protein
VAVGLVYAGFLLGALGLVSLATPLKFLGVATRRAAAGILVLALCLVVTGVALPAPLLALPAGDRARLDAFVPSCQFREVHSIRIHAPPDAVYRAARSVTAREIRFFRLLTWIRSPRFARARREDILAAPADEPLLDVALRSGFILLADDPSRELVFGTILCGRLPGVARFRVRDFLELDRPGFCKAAMNFQLRDEGGGWVRLSTQTRVFALDPSARRRFAVYWRVISPGSAFIRRMWLEAIRRRAEGARSTCLEEMKALTSPVDLALADFESAEAAAGREGSVHAAESVLAAARLARERLEAAGTDPACLAPRREILVFLNHVILGFQAWIDPGAGGAKDSDELGSILRRARAHQKRAIISSLRPNPRHGVPGTTRPRPASETE